jgi:serine/threonine protein kinase
MACVYEASNDAGDEVAVKILHPEALSRREIADRFIKEGTIIERLASHPNSLAFFGAGETPQGHPFIVLERLHGQELGKLWEARSRRLDVDEAIRICVPILDFLDLCHAQGIVHRDLKPANVFICDDGVVKVLDFGVARDRGAASLTEDAPGESHPISSDDADHTRAGTAVGTAAYMAPEQAIGRSDLTDGRADVFAVGAMLYQLVSGAKVRQGQKFEELFVQAATKQAPSLARVAPDLPSEFILAVDKAVAWDPRERYQSAREMRDALIHFQTHGSREESKLPEGLGGTVPVPLLELAPEDETAAVEKDEALISLRKVLDSVEKTMDTVRRYGWEHAETKRRFAACAERVQRALHAYPNGLDWMVKPSSFSQGDYVVWEPAPPFDSIPYNLFGAGIHYLQLNPGLTTDELHRFLRFLMLDPERDLSSEDDLGVHLWEMGFQHVQFQLVSGFQFVEQADEGSAEPGAEEDQEDAGGEEAQEILGMLLVSGKNALAEAQSMRLGIAPQLTSTPLSPQLPPLTDEFRVALSARVARDEEDVERTAVVLVRALVDGERSKDTEKLSTCLQDLVLGYTFRGYTTELIRLLTRVLDYLESAPKLRSYFLKTALSRNLMGPLLDSVVSTRRSSDEEALALLPVLSQVGADAVEAALAIIPRASGALYEELVQFLFEHSLGMELQLGSALHNAKPDFGGALVRILSAQPSPSAKEALRRARGNPDLPLRLSALTAIVENWPNEMALDATPYLTHSDADVRIRVLRLLKGRTDIELVAPLLERVGSGAFEGLPNIERRLLLELLHQLDARRAESALIQLVSRNPALVRNAEQTNTQLLALQCLASWAGSARALEAAEQLASARWGTSPDVKKAAASAVKHIRRRLEGSSP